MKWSGGFLCEFWNQNGSSLRGGWRGGESEWGRYKRHRGIIVLVAGGDYCHPPRTYTNMDVT